MLNGGPPHLVSQVLYRKLQSHINATCLIPGNDSTIVANMNVAYAQPHRLFAKLPPNDRQSPHHLFAKLPPNDRQSPHHLFVKLPPNDRQSPHHLFELPPNDRQSNVSADHHYSVIPDYASIEDLKPPTSKGDSNDYINEGRLPGDTDSLYSNDAYGSTCLGDSLDIHEEEPVDSMTD